MPTNGPVAVHRIEPPDAEDAESQVAFRERLNLLILAAVQFTTIVDFMVINAAGTAAHAIFGAVAGGIRMGGFVIYVRGGRGGNCRQRCSSIGSRAVQQF